MNYVKKATKYLKHRIYLVFFPVIKYLVFLFFKIRRTKLSGALYNSLSYVEGLSYFCINTGSELFVVNLEDKEIAKGLFCKGLFDYDKLIHAIKIVKENNINFNGELLVDVGANIGTISIPAITRNEFNSVIAFEPNPENYKLLRTNLIMNNIEGRFEIHQCAVGNVKTYLDLEISPSNSGDHRISVSSDDGIYNESSREKIKVKSTTLDSAISDVDPNKTLVWVDVQGFEGHVLSGANRILKNKIPIVIEFWPYGLNRSGGFEMLKLSLSEYKGFYDLRSPNNFYDISELDFYYEKIGVDGDFIDLLVL